MAPSLNDLGNAACTQDKHDLAEQYYRREAEIYRSVYGSHHHLLARPLSNLGGVYTGGHPWTRAEATLRAAIPFYIESQSLNSMNTGIGPPTSYRARPVGIVEARRSNARRDDATVWSISRSV